MLRHTAVCGVCAVHRAHVPVGSCLLNSAACPACWCVCASVCPTLRLALPAATSDKEGPDCELERHLADADVIISTCAIACRPVASVPFNCRAQWSCLDFDQPAAGPGHALCSGLSC